MKDDNDGDDDYRPRRRRKKSRGYRVGCASPVEMLLGLILLAVVLILLAMAK